MPRMNLQITFITATQLHYTLPQSSCIITATGRFATLHLQQTMKPHRFPVLRRVSVLAWPAWLRVLALLPAVALMWLAVAWAQLEAAPW